MKGAGWDWGMALSSLKTPFAKILKHRNAIMRTTIALNCSSARKNNQKYCKTAEKTRISTFIHIHTFLDIYSTQLTRYDHQPVFERRVAINDVSAMNIQTRLCTDEKE